MRDLTLRYDPGKRTLMAARRETKDYETSRHWQQGETETESPSGGSSQPG